mgnify:CR=1 FL=1
MISPGIDSNTQSFFFSKGAGGSLLLTQGWLPPETWGVKNREIVSEIRLPSITMYKWEHVSLDFWCRCLGEVCVYVNGKCMATWHPSDLFSHRKLDDLTDFLFIEGGFLFVHFYTKRRADLSIQSCWVNGGKFNNVTSSLLNIEEPLADSIVQTTLFITGIPRSGTSVL